MLSWMDGFGIVLFDAAVATTVFLTLIVMAMLGSRQPARRILLARVALLASLAIIPLVAWGHLPRLDVVDAFVESRLFPSTLFLGSSGVGSRPMVAASTAEVLHPATRIADWSAGRMGEARRWLPRGLTLLDLGCVAAGIGWLGLGLAGVRWLIARSRPPSAAARALFDELAAGQPPSVARAGLRICPRLRHPVVTGLFRPTILIPEVLDRDGGDPGALRLALLHELAHVERSDYGFSTIASLAQSVWFFLPQVWWIRSRMLIDQEFLADCSAASRYGTSSAYASSLLSLAVRSSANGPVAAPPRRPQGASTVAIVRRSPLLQRMMMLLHCPFPLEHRTPRGWSWASRLLVVLTSIAAACLVIRWPHASLAVPAPLIARSPRTRFQALHFLAEPSLDAEGRLRPRVYVLPLTLPQQFDLDVDVRCEGTGRECIRVVGTSIEIPGAGTDDPPGGTTPSLIYDHRLGIWHHVHLHRESRMVSIDVDGGRRSDSPRVAPWPQWLTIEPPPDGPAEFRDLVVTW